VFRGYSDLCPKKIVTYYIFLELSYRDTIDYSTKKMRCWKVLDSYRHGQLKGKKIQIIVLGSWKQILKQIALINYNNETIILQLFKNSNKYFLLISF
jgi:hypothetical protein